MSKIKIIRACTVPLSLGFVKGMLPDLCKKIDAKIVFIGSSGRSGAMAALIGNTCEEIVDQIDADLVVLNDATIQKNSRS